MHPVFKGALEELFLYSQGRATGWGISRIESDGTWTDIPPEELRPSPFGEG
jgi:hypothetical protein